MRIELGLWLTVALAASALAACATANAANAANAANDPWVTLVDKPGGFRLAIQRSWYLVPNSDAKARSLIAQLEQQKETRLAAVYSSIVTTTDVTRFWFEAFAYAPSASIEPTVTLAISRTARAYGAKDLASTGDSVAKGLVTTQGAKIITSKVVALPAGPAAFVQAAEGSGAASSLVEIYVLARGKRLYSLTFRTAAGTRRAAGTFTAIARRFAFA